MASVEKKKEQISKAELLQDLLLDEYKRRIELGALSDTGMGNLQRLLLDSGWSLDAAQIPQELKDKITERLDAENVDESDDDVIDFYKRVANG
jgi:hypothetical protein